MTGAALAYRVTLPAEDDFDLWRDFARRALANDIPPDAMHWDTPASAQAGLFDRGSDLPPLPPTPPPITVPPAFLDLLGTMTLHRDPARFDLAYRLLERVARDRRAADDTADPLMRQAAVMAKDVRRDIHKMRAFVRFRSVAGTTDGEGRYVAWFEPDHHIVRRNAAFFMRRFTNMHWSILTPGISIHWDGETLTESVGAARTDAPQDDAIEDLWRDYYGAIFNPARLKVKAMVKEMPRKYWKNLPEATAIPRLIATAQAREAAMIAAGPQAPGPLPADWAAIEQGIVTCTRCPIGCNGTAAVPGEGPRDARLMIVGEQPGDVEEQLGRPFVGPAGHLLDRHLAAAGIARGGAYLTNGVKHFKHQLVDAPRGKHRLHKTPSPREIDICRWWLDGERALVKPKIIVALGASALRAVTGRTDKVNAVRGQTLPLDDGAILVPTVHPSYLLRLPDAARQAEESARFTAELAIAQTALATRI